MVREKRSQTGGDRPKLGEDSEEEVAPSQAPGWAQCRPGVRFRWAGRWMGPSPEGSVADEALRALPRPRRRGGCCSGVTTPACAFSRGSLCMQASRQCGNYTGHRMGYIHLHFGIPCLW